MVGRVCEPLWLSRSACRRCPRSVGNKASFPPRSPQRLVLQGQNSVVRIARSAAGGPRPAGTARPLSFCALPLEGTSCSPQQGNKRSPSALDLRGKRGLQGQGMLLPQLQGSPRSGGGIPAKPAPRPLEGHRPHQRLKLTALPSVPVIWGWNRLDPVPSRT